MDQDPSKPHRWLVLFTKRGNKIRIHLPVEELAEVLANLTSAFPQVVDVNLVYMKPKAPTEPLQSSSQYWCPYCRAMRRFIYCGEMEVNKCPVCGISDMDFYVKKYNRLWASDAGVKVLTPEAEKRKDRRAKRAIRRKAT